MKLLSIFAGLFLVSCASRPDLSNVKSVAVANGMSDSLRRVKIGTTVFNNSTETVPVPGLSAAMTSAASESLKCRFDKVATVSVATHEPAPSLFVTQSPIDVERFKNDALAAARAKKVDAVWIVYPWSYSAYGQRGGDMVGMEHRCESFLGLSKQSIQCVALGQLLNANSGKVMTQHYLNLPVSPVGTVQAEWKDKFSSYSVTSQREIIRQAKSVGEREMVVLLNLAGVIETPGQLQAALNPH